ncbi:MAG TPA: UDP-N-acetylmuramoyl-L-alanine--D-glutamate ligase [Pseudogracilibacillus sp.]|nr:UDP-N-acetylmuramoyl-L-alanine--D-glutamate ligase [Pseudogracilibacillus sp.]
MRTLKNFPYKHALVLGLAKSGTAAAILLTKSNIKVRVNDRDAKDDDQEVLRLKDLGVEVITGAHPESVLDDIDVIVKNPGIPYDHPLLRLAEKRKIPTFTEIELAYKVALPNDLIGITGSNGKTTTTMLTYEMLKESNLPTKLAGNIGVVASEVAQTLQNEERLLLELSSFQLLGTENFRPKIACILNLYDAHLDYHKTVTHYEGAKAQIFKNQTEEDYLVYNADQEKVVQLIEGARANRVPFSKEKQLKETGAWTDGDFLYFKEEQIVDLNEVALVGTHNIENMLAAIAISKTNGASTTHIRSVLKRFSGVEHRLQFVTELNGRKFYNDSKATNILATQMALQSFSEPTILLAGGLDREEDFERLIPYLHHVKGMVVFGETKEKLAAVAKKAKLTEVHIVNDVKEATKVAYHISQKGDTILLSPACASWDQYKTFEERGYLFIDTVHTLA